MADCFGYEDTYHRALLNGIFFYATDMSDQFGRRGPTHEFPDKEVGAAEDTGQKQPRYTISGWMAGNEHTATAHALRNVARLPAPHRLVHPIWGSLLVRVDSINLKHDVENQKGVTNLTIEATDFGGLSFPSASLFVGSLISKILATLVDLIRAAFAIGWTLFNFSPSDLIQIDAAIASAALAIYNEFVEIVEWNASTTDISDRLLAIAANPEIYRSQPDIEFNTAIEALQAEARTQEKATEALERLMQYGSGDIVTTGSNAAEVAAHLNMLVSCVRVNATAYAVESAVEAIRDQINVQVGGDLRTLQPSQSRFQSSYDAIEFMSTCTAVLRGEVSIAQARRDDAYVRGLRDLMHATIEEIQKIAYDLPPSVVTNLILPLPSLVAAYRATGDAKRVREVECRNPGRSVWFMRRTIEHRTENLT